MRILLTGANGYIGKRLLPVLLGAGHEVICVVRNAKNFEPNLKEEWNIEILEHDFLYPVPVDQKVPLDFDAAYFLIHSMSASIQDFKALEKRTAQHFREFMDRSNARQVIYLSGMVNGDELSEHLASRFGVEQVLEGSKVPLTVLRAGIIVGSGSASFEIIRDLVEKLPIMVAPKWLDTKCEPLAIRNVIHFLTGVLLREETFNRNFDIGCDEVLSYKDMLQGYAEVRGLKRFIFTVPVMTPRLSSYWLYFVTSTTYELAVNLVDSMKVDVVARDHSLADSLGIELIPYKKAVELAFERIEQNMVVSSWKDSLVSSSNLRSLQQYIQVPRYGCFIDRKEMPIASGHEQGAWSNIQAIGGDRGWYYANLLWRLRGLLDKLVGGIGLRRGRTNPERVHPGDALDFWRVLVADSGKKRMLLYAEMKLPGEAWLEFHIQQKEGQSILCQTATFRPNGVLGRLYWYCVLPFHYFVFKGMARNIIRFKQKEPEVTSGKVEPHL